MSRARYSARFNGQIILVIDEYSDAAPTMSVTNDAEAVTAEVVAKFGDHRIAYRDTDGQWDELRHSAGDFQGFAPLDEFLRKEVQANAYG